MKTSTLKYAAIAALALSFAPSCSKEIAQINPETAPEIRELHFTVTSEATSPVVSKSYLDNNLDGTYTPKWSKGDSIAVFTGGIFADTAPDGTLSNQNEDGTTASFDGTLTAADEGEFKAVAPAARVLGGCIPEEIGAIVGVSLGDPDNGYVQNPTYETIDPASDILVSKPTAYTSDGSSVVLDDIYFKRVMSVVKINVKGPESLSAQKISNFKMTSSSAVLSGKAKVDVTNVRIAGWTEGSNSAAAEYSAEADRPSLYDADGLLNTVYLVVNPTTLSAGTTLTFSGETGDYHFSKEVTLSEDIVFPEGQMATIGLTLTAAHLTSKIIVNFNGWKDQSVKVKNTNFAFSPDGGTAYIMTYNTSRLLGAFNLTTGAKKWEYDLNYAYNNGGHIAVNPSTGDVIVCNATTLFSIKADGTVRWSADIAELTTGCGPAFSPDAKTLYVGLADKKVYAFNAETGALLGNTDALAANLAAIIVNGTELFVTTKSTTGYFLDFSDPADIKELATINYKGAGVDVSSPSVAPDKKTAYFPTMGYFNCVDLSTRTIKKSVELVSNSIVCGSVVTPSGDVATVYKNAKNASSAPEGGTMVMYSAGLEKLKWSITPITNKNIFNYNCPTVDENGDLYIVDGKGNAWFINAEDGSYVKLYTGPQDTQGCAGMCGDILLSAGNAAPATVLGRRVATARGAGWSGNGGDICCTKCIQWVYPDAE